MRQLFVKIPDHILTDSRLSLSEAVLLSLISGMKKGLKLDNSAIAKLLRVSPKHVGRLIKSLEAKNLVRIEHKQSRYRTIYSCLDAEVNSSSTPALMHPTLPSMSFYSASDAEHKGIKEKTIRATLSPAASPQPVDWNNFDPMTADITHPATPEEIEELKAEGLL